MGASSKLDFNFTHPSFFSSPITVYFIDRETGLRSVPYNNRVDGNSRAKKPLENKKALLSSSSFSKNISAPHFLLQGYFSAHKSDFGNGSKKPAQYF